MSPKPPYVVREWISTVAELKGDAWFRLSSLHGELRNKGLLLKADAVWVTVQKESQRKR